MLIGSLLWYFLSTAVILLAALGIILLRARVNKSKGPISPRSWIRITLVFFVLCMIGLTEGALLSPYGFGWFVVAMSVTLYIVAKCLPRFIRLDG
jgi:hypothetical protein